MNTISRMCVASTLLLALSTTAYAQSNNSICEPITTLGSPNSSLIVGEVIIDANDVFDLGLAAETQFIHRLGNRLHKQTNPDVIKQQLLFKRGDAFSAAKIAESERLLRQNDYLKSASITAVERCGNAITVKVTTRDHWSLIPKVSFKRTGGENLFGFEVTEANLFGWGKELSVAFQQGSVRDQTILEYKDKNVFGSRKQLTLQWQDNSDGERQLVDLKQPFFSFNTGRAWRLAVDNSRYLSRLYANRKVTTIFDLDSRFADINYGVSKGLQGDTLHRFWLGARFDETTLIDTSDPAALVEFPERRFVYPYLSWQLQKPNFVIRSNLFMMDQVEDVSLGHFFEARIGYASESFDSSENAVVLHGEYRKGWQGKNSLGLFKTRLDTFRLDDDFANTVLRPELQWFWFQSQKRTLYLSAAASLGDKLFAENQFLAGGNNGLRGYPLRMQSGDKRVLLSAEQRWYLDWYPWNLVRIGAAAFVDAGSAWNSDEQDNPDWLGNAGVGLRFLSTRQANAPVTHVDLAIPFDQRDDIDDVQLVVVSKVIF